MTHEKRAMLGIAVGLFTVVGVFCIARGITLNEPGALIAGVLIGAYVLLGIKTLRRG